MKLKVSEIFYSVQGEGPNIGVPSVFIRLAGCNLRCRFCDTRYAWDQYVEMTPKEVCKEILKSPCRNLVITGGEPMLQQEGICTVLDMLTDDKKKFFVEIETNGTIHPYTGLLLRVNRFIVSPKLSNAGVKAKIDDCYTYFPSSKIAFKFVIDTKEDLQEVEDFIQKYKINPEVVYLMPQATTVEEQIFKLPFIIEFAKQKGYKVTPRLQILAYGNMRGV